MSILANIDKGDLEAALQPTVDNALPFDLFKLEAFIELVTIVHGHNSDFNTYMRELNSTLNRMKALHGQMCSRPRGRPNVKREELEAAVSTIRKKKVL